MVLILRQIREFEKDGDIRKLPNDFYNEYLSNSDAKFPYVIYGEYDDVRELKKRGVDTMIRIYSSLKTTVNEF